MSVKEKRRGFPRVKIGVSACLLGQEVRFNGGHKRDGFLTGPLAGFVDFVPLCPEVGIGMGIPRPPIRLVGGADQPRAVGTDDPVLDVTAKLESFARAQEPALAEISGYVLQHMMGYFKRSIDAGDKAELLATIDAYRRGEVPLVVPVTLLRHYLRRHPDPYMERQHYLHPHPDELSLRNAI